MTAVSMSLQVARSLFVATMLASVLVPQSIDAYFDCPAVFSANFETGASGWSGFVNASGSDFSWRRQSGQTPTSGTGPDNDVTYRNSSGHYLYMEEDAGPQGASAIVSTPVITVPSVFQEDCYVTFHYSMQGIDVGQLSIYTMDVGSTVPAPVSWTKTADQCTSTGWKFGQAKLNYGPGNHFQVYFNGTATEDGVYFQGDIGIDNVLISCCAGCRATNIRSFVDFSSESDGYMNSAADNFNWLRISGPVPTAQTGPLYDHTTLDPGCRSRVDLGGYYMYIETSSPVLTGHQAILWSPPFTAPATPSTCFVSFWYSMYGGTVGSLKVATNLTSQPDARWCRNGQQTSTVTNWRRGLFWVQAPGSTFQVSFTGIKGASFAGDIGLDDIDISCCAESCVHFNRLTFECDNEDLIGRGSTGFTYQTSVGDQTTLTKNGARIFANSSQAGTIAKNLTAPNTMGMNCTVSFYFWIDVPSDNAAVADVMTAGMAGGLVFWGLRDATTKARAWMLQSGTFHLPAPEVSFQVTWKTFFGNGHAWTVIYMDDIDFVCCPAPPNIASTTTPNIAPTTSTTITPTKPPTTAPTATPTNAPTTKPTVSPTTTPATARTTPPATTKPTTAPRTTNPTGHTATNSTTHKSATVTMSRPGGIATISGGPSAQEVSSTSVGIVAGAIACGFVILVLVILLVVLLLRSRRSTPLTISIGGEKSKETVHNPIYEDCVPSSPLPSNHGRGNQPSRRCDSRYAQSPQQLATACNGNWTMLPSPPPAESSSIDLTTNTAYGIQRPPLPLPHQVAGSSTVGMTTNTAYGVRGRSAPRTSPVWQQTGSECSRLQQRGSVQERDGQEFYSRLHHRLTTAYSGNWTTLPSPPPAEPPNIGLTTNIAYGVQPSGKVPITDAIYVDPTLPEGDQEKHQYEVPDPPSEKALITEAISTDPMYREGDREKHQYEVPDPTETAEDRPYLEIIP